MRTGFINSEAFSERRLRDLAMASLGEGLLLLVLAALGWFVRWPFVFTSLGPTAYELVERPNSRSARTYNIIVGHFVGLACGFAGVWLARAGHAPIVSSAGYVSGARVWACVISVVLTTVGMLLLRAGQPAALSTTLVVSLGSMQSRHDAAAIVIAVLIIATIGEPIRRARLSRIPKVERDTGNA